VRFAAVALLKGAPVEHTARRRVRELLLLALRVTALVLLAFAFARPFFRAASATSARLTVVAIDTSLSMSAPASFARARQLASDAIQQAPRGDEVAVVVFADRADALVRPTSDRGLATSAIAALAPGFGSTNYVTALAAAGDFFKGRGGTIAVVTDLQGSGWDAGNHGGVPEDVVVEVRDVGPLAENVSVDAVRSENDRIVASIRNAGARARDVRARLTVDGRASGQTMVSVGARGVAEAVFSNVRTAGVAAVTVDDPGGIAGDDARYTLIGGEPRATSLVVTTSGDLDKDAWYIRHALTGVRGIATAELGRWSDDAISRFGAVIVLSTHGLERPGRAKLAAYANAGGGVLIAAGPDVDGDVVADALGPAAALEIKPASGALESTGVRDPERAALRMGPADVRHPIFRSFGAEVASLGLVQFRSVARVNGRSCQTIARFTSGEPAMLDCVAGSGRAIVFASDLNDRWNDFPLRASFVPFLDQTVRYLTAGAGRASEYLVGDVPAGIAPVPGVATVRTRTASRRVVVNVDPKESEVNRISAADFQASITRLKNVGAQTVRADAAEQESRQHLWQYLLAAMIVVLMAEGVVATRMA
jgi:hypothetical protein